MSWLNSFLIIKKASPPTTRSFNTEKNSFASDFVENSFVAPGYDIEFVNIKSQSLKTKYKACLVIRYG